MIIIKNKREEHNNDMTLIVEEIYYRGERFFRVKIIKEFIEFIGVGKDEKTAFNRAKEKLKKLKIDLN